MTCYFDNRIYYQNCSCDIVLRDDAMLVPCDSHLWAMWAMQPLWSTATIEFCPLTRIVPCGCLLGVATPNILPLCNLT